MMPLMPRVPGPSAHRGLLAAVLFVAIVPGGVAAQEPSPTASLGERLREAQRLLANDPTGAVERLDELAVESIELRATRLLEEPDRALHRELFLARARAHLQLLDNDAALDSFRELFRLDPAFVVDQLAPLEQQLANELRSQEGGFLEIQAGGPGFEVRANGVPIGITTGEPFRAMLVAGDYDIQLAQEGFQSAEGRTTVEIARVTTLRDLAPQLVVPPIALVTSVADVSVLVGGQVVGRTAPLSMVRGQLGPEQASALDRAMALTGFGASTAGALVLRAPPLDRAIEFQFQRDCFVEATRRIAVTTEAARQLGQREPLLWFGDASAVEMTPNVGTLRVTSSPDGAEVFIDEELVGRAPLERQVCAGSRQIRVQHEIGAYSTTVTVLRDRLETVEAPIRPTVAVIGGVETDGQTLRPSRDLGFRLEQALGTVMTTFVQAELRPAPDDVQQWTTLSTARLVAASDRGDDAEVRRLLEVARRSFGAPLLIAGVQRPAMDGGEEPPIDLLVFWMDHVGVDRLRWRRLEEPDLERVLAPLDSPVDLASLVYRNSIGVRTIDTTLPDAPLMIAHVDEGSAAASSGLQAGDAIEAIDGRVVTTDQLEERIRQAREGDLLEVRIARGAAPAELLSVPVRRVPQSAPVFDRTLFGNAVMAKLTAARLLAGSRPERDLVAFSLALANMRYAEWQTALDVLEGLGELPVGVGVGPGAALYYRGWCLEALGDPASARRMYQEATAYEGEVLTDDGGSVAIAARRRLAGLTPAAAP